MAYTVEVFSHLARGSKFGYVRNWVVVWPSNDRGASRGYIYT
jgi:hypothetical protein